MSRTPGLILVAGAVGLLLGPVAAQSVSVLPGDPLPGLTSREFEGFRVGLEEFVTTGTIDEGFGPAFNGNSCAACHSIPAIGGISPIAELRVGYRASDGAFRPLDGTGNTLIHLFSLPNHACQEIPPDGINVVARRIPIPLFGAGLVEAIPDDTLLALADPLDRNGDGVQGRASVVTDPATGEQRVGRFGWKAQVATLLTFSGDAYRNEMGVTNAVFPEELIYDLSADKLKGCKLTLDPEDKQDPRSGLTAIEKFTLFMRFLAPIARGPIDDTVRDGERIFAAVGCAACHVPRLTTGPSSNPLFNRAIVPLFSDLLLHNIGTGDGIKQADSTASPDEIRTAALWGLRLRRPFLHDGSAATIEEAIVRHQGEGESARKGFVRLDDRSRLALLAFLRSL
jgi:CxxC motif-containing protein (DUF1111 family)